jgi:hypothetical protein
MSLTNRQQKTTKSSRATASKRRPTQVSGTRNSSDRARWQTIVSIFILFHLIAITCWASPWNIPVVRDVKELVRPYLLWSGLFQSWDMFAPNPKPENAYVRAVVITSDRHIKVWNFPRMEELSFGQRYQKERYRKFVESILDQKNEALLPDAANHIARQFNNPLDPPDKVMLIQFQSTIKPWVDDTNEPTPKPNIFYDEYVQPGDLR